MFLPKTTSWLLFCALLCWECAFGAHLPHNSLTERSSVAKVQEQPEPRAPANPGPTLVSPSSSDTARSVGIHVHPLTRPILPQALTQCLVQALWAAFADFGTLPVGASNSFHHSVSSRVPNYNVQLEMAPTSHGTTGEYLFTNYRVAETMSLLGYEYSNHQNSSSMVEYTFDVVIDVWGQPEVVIATGSVRNIPDPDAPAATIGAKFRK